MAALMPGAEADYKYELVNGDLVPVVAGTPLLRITANSYSWNG